MSDLPTGVERRTVAGEERLTTAGEPVYGEPTVDGRRVWDAGRSKLGAMLELGMDTRLDGGESVLYLGAASGTTVSHVAEFAGPTYAVEFAPRPVRDLVDVAESRGNLFPLLADARKPRTYAGVVEANLDCIVQDVATRAQAAGANRNAQFLGDDGLLRAAVKARSEDVVAEPATVFDEVTAALGTEYDILETATLEPYHDDHLGVVGRRR
jgi:fibrillarin-like pre-rRNA processing protein